METTRSFRRVVFEPKTGILGRLRALGIMRLVFVAVFFLLYSVLVLWSLVGDADPHEKFRFQAEAIEEEESLAFETLFSSSRSRKIFLEYAAPSQNHPLGTDERGRDVLTRLAHGARTSLVTGCICLFFFLAVGTAVGVAAGYFEGRWHALVVYLFNLINTFPILLLLLLSVIIIDGIVDNPRLRIYLLMAFLGLFSSPKLAELIRGKIASLKETAFIHAAVSLGLGPAQIIGKHILWYECRPLILVQSAYMMGQAILVETTLTYLNFGLESPMVSWGLMLRTMAAGIFTGKIQVMVVMAVIALSVFFFQYLAALLNDLLATDRARIGE